MTVIIKMKNNHNAAIIILAARIPLLDKVLQKLYFNWNINFHYPIYIHTFGKLISEKQKKAIKHQFKNLIFFCEVNPEFPKHIPEKELFYNRKYLNYVAKAFPKKRSGYLHMCYFKTNITGFGHIGCLDAQLKKYDKLMFYDDDNELKQKINYDLFDSSNDYPIVTGFLTKRKSDSEMKDITQNLWNFYKKFINYHNISPKNQMLKKAIETNNSDVIFDIPYSCGALEIYNLKLLNNDFWNLYINEANKFGGNYKYRWGDMQVINLFVRTFFDKPILNLNLLEKEILNNKINGSDHFIYFNNLDVYQSKIFKLLVKLKHFIFS